MRVPNLALLGFLVAGCGTSPATPVRDRTLYLIAVDRSKSTEPIRRALLARTHELASELDPATSSVRVFRFGSSCEEFSDGPIPDEDTLALELARVASASDPTEGTSYATVLKVMADEAASASEGHVCPVIIGDGLDDTLGDVAQAKRYREAVVRLCQNSRVATIAFWGPSIGREPIRHLFEGYQSKLVIRSLDQPIAD